MGRIRHEVDAVIRACSASAHGVIELGELTARGVPKSAVRWRVSTGELEQLGRGVFRVAAVPVTDLQRRLIVVRRAGPGSRVTAVSAMRTMGHDRFREDRIEVVTPTRSRSGSTETDIRVVAGIGRTPMNIVDGIPLTTDAWTITELGRCLTALQIANAIHILAFRNPRLAREIREVLALRGSFRGASVVRAALALHDARSRGTRSYTEDRFEWGLRRGGFPIATVNTPPLFGASAIEPDFVFEDQGVIVELDGGQHGRPHDQGTDEGRDVAYAAAGFRLERFSARQVWRELDRCLERVRSALENRPVRRCRSNST